MPLLRFKSSSGSSFLPNCSRKMDLLSVLYFDELSHGLANLSMFPFFDMAHYIVSVMALREQPGECLRDVDDSSSCQVYSVKWLFSFC